MSWCAGTGAVSRIPSLGPALHWIGDPGGLQSADLLSSNKMAVERLPTLLPAFSTWSSHLSLKTTNEEMEYSSVLRGL
jgi:hypothetical protein